MNIECAVRWLIASLAVVTAGCVPNAQVYYRPTVEGGAVMKGHCVPLESGVDFLVGPVPVVTRVLTTRNGDFVYLSIKRVPDTEFHFKSARFSIREKGGRVLAEPKLEIDRDDRLDTVTAPFPQEAQPGARKVVATFRIYVPLPSPVPESFELNVPPLVVAGREYPFPAVGFERKVWMGISPFNC